MSKKIIYLLSLLMALSLVFASCKKNNSITGGDIATPPDEEDNTSGIVDESTGLIKDFGSLPTDKVIKKETIFQGDGANYLRNPVVVVMGAKSNQVAVFGEKRYRSKGAANDVGINGTDVVDIIVRVSANAGVRFGSEAIVGANATSADNSHGAPVVFKVGDNKVVVVASAGAGIARTADYAGNKTPSRIDYIIGTLNGETFNWGAGWKTLDINGGAQSAEKTKLLEEVQKINTGNASYKFDQMGTQSARGLVSSSGSSYTLILPVIMAQQGTTTDIKELMGVYFVKGTYNGNGDVTWENLSSSTTYVAFNAKSENSFSKYKEAQVITGTTDSDVKFIAVPSPWGSPVTGQFGFGSGMNQPSATSINGHDGAPGYLTLKWYGDQNYTPESYKNDSSSADKSLFLGVKGDAANVTLYLVDKDTLNNATRSYLVNAVGKSGSIDVLGDGTIVTAAEEGANGDRNYYTSFTRYSQSYLNSLLQ